MDLTRTLLPALITSLLLVPFAPASAAPPERVTVNPETAPTGQLTGAWVHSRTLVLHDDGTHTRITGIKGHARQVAQEGDGWLVRARGLYTVDSDGAATQIMRRRPTEGFEIDGEGRVAIQTEGPGKRERATVFDAVTGDRVGRYLAYRVRVLDYLGDRVWLSVRDRRDDRWQLVLWDAESDDVDRRNRFGIDGLDAEHGVAWRMKRHRTSFFPLIQGDWSRWSARHYRFVNPTVSPDGRHVVTHTRRGEEPNYPYAGSMVVRELETGGAVVDFRGYPYAEPFWADKNRFVSQYFKNGDSLRVAQMRLTLTGAQRRVSPFHGGDVKRVLVGAPQPILSVN